MEGVEDKTIAVLRNKRVAILGIGGIGSHVGVALTRAGVGNLRLVDFEVVDASNLGRQCYTQQDVGRKKTVALKEVLQQIRSDVVVETKDIYLTENNVLEILQEEEYVIEAFDLAETKAMLTPEILHAPQLKVLIGCSGMAGWGNAAEIMCKRMRDNWYLCGDFKSDIEEQGKITAARVMVCAGMMAHQMLRVLMGEE